METPKNQTLYVCGCCKRELPQEAFYQNKRKQCRDNYCKECRKNMSRKRREIDKYIPFVNKRSSYPVITQVKDVTLRKALIQHALQVVAASIERKKRKIWESEDSCNP